MTPEVEARLASRGEAGTLGAGGESGVRARAIVEATLDCVITIDGEGRVLEFNPAAERTFGYQREDVLGKSIAELIVPERLRAKHLSGLARYTRTGVGPIIGKRVELPALRADGSEILVELAVTRLDVPGPPTFMAMLRDVVEAEHSERVRRSQDFYRLVVETSNDLTALLDLDGRVVYASPSHEDKLGYIEGSLVGTELLALVHPEDADHVRTAFLEARKGSRSIFPPVRLLRTDGSWLDVEGSITGVVDADANVSVVLVKASDVSERLHLERAQERREWAEQDFVANAAHELQTPLTAITAAVEVLQAGAKRNANDLDVFLGDIEREAARLRRLTRALLELARLQTGEPAPVVEPVELPCLIRDIASGLPFADNVNIVTACPSDLFVLGDRDILELALWNLARNAAAYTDSGTIEIEARRKDDSVEIVVRDTGTGMSPLARERALERFYRGHGRHRPGFGLGLAIVSEATRLLDGTIEIESELGIGTSVCLTMRAG